MLLPPLRDDSENDEKNLHDWTEAKIAQVAERQASLFLAGPAHYLIDTDSKNDFSTKLYAIYQDAATISYLLWTRRTTMELITLKEFGHLTFDINKNFLTPHTLVHPDEHEDQLKGRPVTVIVHPLLEVCGTVEAKDYDQRRVWAAAEVWLDSKAK